MAEAFGRSEVWDARCLPENALDAACVFAEAHIPALRARSLPVCHVVFDPAGHDHKVWRAAAIASLARDLAPCRVNGIAGADIAALQKVLDFLDQAGGVTGHMLTTEEGAE